MTEEINKEEQVAPAVAPVVQNEHKEGEDVGHKVFVGNLSFQTTEEELAEFFGSIGTVLKANIITRGTRSLGYGFVAYETLAEAELATQQLDKKELRGREINVEVAKPKDETPRDPSTKPFRGRGRGGKFRGRGDKAGAPRQGPRRFPNQRRGHSDTEEASPDSDNLGFGEVATNTETTVATAAATTVAADTATTTATPTATTTATTTVTTNGTVKPPEPTTENKVEAVDLSEPTDEAAARGAFRGRGRGRRRGRGGRGRGLPRGAPRGGVAGRGRRASLSGNFHEEPSGEPSKTTVFVANLPYALDDEGLKLLFKEYNVNSAHVVKTKSGRSKGFGFVDLVNEEEQKKVLEGMKNVRSDDREIIIKVALSEPHVYNHEEEEGEEEDVKKESPKNNGSAEVKETTA